MISDRNTLRSRGYIEDSSICEYKTWDKEALITLFRDTEAVKRSVAAKLLSIKFGVNTVNLARLFLEQLCKETKLYTRLEICTALEGGNEITATEMVQYIGKIGKNQHKTLPTRPSLKKRFPLPRDLIARSLGRMDEKIMPVLNKVLYSNDINKISEVLDAIGFLAFYNEAARTEQNLNSVLEVIDTYRDNSLIQWKGIICLTAFPFQASVNFLQDSIRNSINRLFVKEAERSLTILKRSDKVVHI